MGRRKLVENVERRKSARLTKIRDEEKVEKTSKIVKKIGQIIASMDLKQKEHLHMVMSGFMPELLEGILSCLSPFWLCRLSTVCKDWRAIAERDTIWKPICLRERVKLGHDSDRSYKGVYKEYVLCRRKWRTGTGVRKVCTQLKNRNGRKLSGSCVGLSSRHIFAQKRQPSPDMAIYVYSAAGETAGQYSHQLAAQPCRVLRLLHSADENVAVAYPEAGKVVTVWNVDEATLLHTITAIGQVCGLALHQNMLACVMMNKSSAFVFDISTGQTVHELTGHVGFTWMVDIDGDSVATCCEAEGDDEVVKVWDVHTGACRHTWTQANDGFSTSMLMVDDASHSVARGSMGQGGFTMWDSLTGAVKTTRLTAGRTVAYAFLKVEGKLYVHHYMSAVCQYMSVVDLVSGDVLSTKAGGGQFQCLPLHHPSLLNNGLLVSQGANGEEACLDLWDIKMGAYVRKVYVTDMALCKVRTSAHQLQYVACGRDGLLKFVTFNFGV